MKRHFLTCILLAMAALTGVAHGQGCPAGTYPSSGSGVFTCLPMTGTQQSPSAPQQPVLPPAKWESRWGAVATDGVKGALGVVTGMKSRAAAESIALEDCKAKGGTECILDVAYDNSCVAMSVGDKGYSVKTGQTLEEAIANATNACGASDTNCHTYYSNCSLPVRTQ